ncbi:kinesin-like protein KIF15 [Trichogramma pretiosum]|uniref:kinesin-like protein KIF15 n=1 Tax=Trichogramma pretiosum TaxID=7493 RepID=UPI0006C9C753|nr:kinesin-like protein KIF15 [Trichogramma pretiosum]
MQSDVPPLPVSCLSERISIRYLCTPKKTFIARGLSYARYVLLLLSFSLTNTRHAISDFRTKVHQQRVAGRTTAAAVTAAAAAAPSKSQSSLNVSNKLSPVGSCALEHRNQRQKEQKNNHQHQCYLPLSTRKQLQSLIAFASPYSNCSARSSQHHHQSENNPGAEKEASSSVIGRRVCSAKMLRIKHLQNQLADAHYHLNELSNENKLLRAIQKRQDSALKRYEGSNAELPRIINTHHEDFRVLQAKHSKLRAQCKELQDRLKDKDSELLTLQAQNKKLQQLSKDRHLPERDKLQQLVADLQQRCDEQERLVQQLRRKLELETKYLKQQLHGEMAKHKEAAKQLAEARRKLESMDELLERSNKRSYQASRLGYNYRCERGGLAKRTADKVGGRLPVASSSLQQQVQVSQSLVDLNDFRAAGRQIEASFRLLHDHHPSSSLEFEARREARQITDSMLPMLSNNSNNHNNNHNGTMENNRVASNDPSEYLERIHYPSSSTRLSEPSPIQHHEKPSSHPVAYSLQRDDGETETLAAQEKRADPTSGSRSLHARLVSSASEAEDDAASKRRQSTKRTSTTNGPSSSSRSRSLTKENLDRIAEYNDELADEIKYDRDSVVTVIAKEPTVARPIVAKQQQQQNKCDASHHESNISLSDVESEIDLPIELSLEDDDEDEPKPTTQQQPIVTPWDDDKRAQDDVSTPNKELLLAVDSKVFDKPVEQHQQQGNKDAATSKAAFDKAKLLAAMRAIDNNETTVVATTIPSGGTTTTTASRRNSATSLGSNGLTRLQITENLFRGLPTHSKKKDIMKELFPDAGPIV